MSFDSDPNLAPPVAMPEPAPIRTRRRPGAWPMAVLTLVVLPLVIAAGLTAFGSAASDPSNATVVNAATLEADYGIRVDLVAVTASGGLIDLRFTVVDEAKARALFHDPETRPALFVEGKGTVLRTRKGMAHHLTLITGGRYFMLFSNSGGVIQAGTRVSVVVDGVRLEPMTAKS